jgi:demethylsterigmatocystin 6-O-methyltransferase
MESALNQIRDLHAKANANERQKIHDQLRDLQNDLSPDWDILFGIGMGPLNWSMAQIGLDLNIFTTLLSSSTPLTHTSLVQSTGAAPKLLQHLLRAMASFGFIQETAKDCFAANRTTRVFADPNIRGATPHLTDLHLPVALALPGYLKEHKYQDITDAADLPFHKALNTTLAPFEWMKSQPEQMKALGHIMVLDAVQSWVSSYPVEQAVAGFTPSAESALLVDVGGGFGTHSVFFKNKFPDLPGRIVVQDIPSTLAHAPRVPGIEFQEHDFFTAQPVRGAKFYYMRHIMHDWNDGDCIRILEKISPAMGPESLILIDDVVLPEQNMPWQVAMMDIGMMACLGGIERTQEDWEDLLDRAGLKLVGVHKYDEVKHHGIVSAVPK